MLSLEIYAADSTIHSFTRRVNPLYNSLKNVDINGFKLLSETIFLPMKYQVQNHERLFSLT